MDKVLQFFYKLYKKIRPPKRLYKFGTIGLSHYDDRTKSEKFWDRLDEYWFRWEQERRYKNAYRKQVWHSYFDVGLGKIVTSSEEIRNKEKQGYVYMSDKDWERETSRRAERNRRERKEKTRKAMEEGFAKIRSGNSNFYEQYQRRVREGK